MACGENVFLVMWQICGWQDAALSKAVLVFNREAMVTGFGPDGIYRNVFQIRNVLRGAKHVRNGAWDPICLQ